MPHIEISKNIFNCEPCHTRCDGKSKGKYFFENDVQFAEAQEQKIITILNKSGKYIAQKCQKEGFPDIEIQDKNKNLLQYVEVKAQRRTFMSVQRFLPKSGLHPSETLALNLSDLKRYFEIESRTMVPISIVWVLMNRPCILQDLEIKYFYQKTKELARVFRKHKNSRRFKRQSGIGDVVNGEHKGVVINYHFSINELIPWNPNSI